jgi:hypothetical protein
MTKDHAGDTQVCRYLRYLSENVNKAPSTIRKACIFISIKENVIKYRNEFRYKVTAFLLQGNRIRLYFSRDKPLLEDNSIYSLQ